MYKFVETDEMYLSIMLSGLLKVVVTIWLATISIFGSAATDPIALMFPVDIAILKAVLTVSQILAAWAAVIVAGTTLYKFFREKDK